MPHESFGNSETGFVSSEEPPLRTEGIEAQIIDQSLVETTEIPLSLVRDAQEKMQDHVEVTILQGRTPRENAFTKESARYGGVVSLTMLEAAAEALHQNALTEQVDDFLSMFHGEVRRLRHVIAWVMHYKYENYSESFLKRMHAILDKTEKKYNDDPLIKGMEQNMAG